MPFIHTPSPLEIGPETALVRFAKAPEYSLPSIGHLVLLEDSPATQTDFISPRVCVDKVFENTSGAVGITRLEPVSIEPSRAKITIRTSQPVITPGCGEIIKDVLSSATASVGSGRSKKIISRSVFNFYTSNGVTLDKHKDTLFPRRLANGFFNLENVVTIHYRRGTDGKLVRVTKKFSGQTTAE